jgi:hypothetical protein
VCLTSVIGSISVLVPGAIWLSASERASHRQQALIHPWIHHTSYTSDVYIHDGGTHSEGPKGTAGCVRYHKHDESQLLKEEQPADSVARTCSRT